MDENPWHVLQVIANHEKRVAQHLAARSLVHYLPLYTERSQWTDRVVSLERPLFTGYVFVRISPQTRIAALSAPGVLRLLGDATSNRVSAAEISRIREGLASGCLLRPHPEISVGEPVRVERGIFAGVEGVVAEFRPQCKVIITLSATRQCFSLETGIDDIKVLRKPALQEVVFPSRSFDLSDTWYRSH